MSFWRPIFYQARWARVLPIKQTYGAIALLMVPTVVVALMADCALAAEMPKDFQGTWCTSSDTFKDGYMSEAADCEGNYRSVEITATGVKSPALSVACYAASFRGISTRAHDLGRSRRAGLYLRKKDCQQAD
jgi:hypothetical protein